MLLCLPFLDSTILRTLHRCFRSLKSFSIFFILNRQQFTNPIYVKRLCDYNDFTNDVNLTTSCEILRNATEDIFSTVPSGNWTVFAPVAEAFERPPANVISRGELIYFGQFHVVNEARLSSSFECKSTNRDNKILSKW